MCCWFDNEVRRKTTQINENQIVGTAKNMAGKVQETAGDVQDAAEDTVDDARKNR